MNTKEHIISHISKYPLLELQDILKFLHQSSFGCEHMVSSLESAKERIQSEFKDNSEIPLTEPLDGNYSRVHLSHLNSGLSADTLAKLFFLSSKPEPCGKTELEKKLSVVSEIAGEGKLPFSGEDFVSAVIEWRNMGFTALHHSDTFRNAYHPSYRVVLNEYVRFLPLFSAIDTLLERGNVKLAIEGGSASGKSTLADLLEKVYDCTVFHMDDFFLRPSQRTPERLLQAGGNIDKERFLKEVLVPLAENKKVNYQRFNCETLALMPPVSVTPKKLTVIEGAYSMHPEMSSYYDLSVFLNVDPEIQKIRISKRNTPYMQKRFFEEWIPLEHLYFNTFCIKEHCSLIISVNE